MSDFFPRRVLGYVLVWIFVLAIFFGVYQSARRALLNEVRHHAMGVAIAVAEAVDAADLEQVKVPADLKRGAGQSVQDLLTRTSQANPDVRYIYTMRRSQARGARISDLEYVVDEPARDEDSDGVIGPDEISEPPGNPYDAAEYPEMVAGWDAPNADWEVTPDPPYPDMLSGYAPVRDETGKTVAIVGVDIIAPTIRRKLHAVHAALVVSAFLTGALVSMVLHLNHRARRALEDNQRLSDQLRRQNEDLAFINTELSEHNEQYERELKLAQTVQEGFLPTTFPRQDRISFDKCYLTCEILGGDLYDVFEIDEKRMGMYIADVSGHGVSAALIAGLLKMAIASIRDAAAAGVDGMDTVLRKPERTLQALHDMIGKHIPEYQFITMVYGVLDLDAGSFRLANAGHLHPLRYNAQAQQLEEWEIPSGGALGLLPDSHFSATGRTVHTGDKIILYTDGLTEAMNEQHEEYGEDRLLEVVQQFASESPARIVDEVRTSVDLHRAGCAVSDDFTMLVAEIR